MTSSSSVGWNLKPGAKAVGAGGGVTGAVAASTIAFGCSASRPMSPKAQIWVWFLVWSLIWRLLGIWWRGKASDRALIGVEEMMGMP